MSAPLPAMLRSVAAAQRGNCDAAVCVIVSAHGSTPQPAGAVMFVDAIGRVHGTIGGGCIEAELRRRALAMLSKRESGFVRFTLDGDYGWDDGLICGGVVELAVAPAPSAEELERVAAAIDGGMDARLDVEVAADEAREQITLHIPPRPRLLIAGAGHIGRAVARHAIALDFDATLFDDRPDLLAGFRPPLQTACGDIAARLADARVDANTYCVIVTRGHRHDAQALAAVVGRGARYVGMIGSRRKVAVTFTELEARGIPRRELERVHAPIGLDIGARTVQEIALAVAAQLVHVRSAGRRHEPVIERRPIAPAGPRAAPIGVLLAAGRSTRMRQTKQIMPLPGDGSGRALVAAAFDAIAPACSHMVVVTAHNADRVCAALGSRSFTRAHAPLGAEMIESILCGLRRAAEINPAAPVLLHLADHPHVAQRTLAAVLGAALANPDLAVIPTHRGRGGHPALIPPGVAARIIAAGEIGPRARGGLREFWRCNPELCMRLAVGDPSVIVDIDRPDDYRALDAAAALRAD
jgi:xanthine dehydrogenase accessory factor